MLDVENLSSGYGKTQILHDISLSVAQGEVVALLGRNGAGKSTLLKTIMGIVATRAGEVRFLGSPLGSSLPYQIARLGLCLVPEDRRIFSLLSVEENLQLAVRRGSAWSMSDVFELFPRLRERRANKGDKLSGGEQQMLSIGRALLNAPKLILLDEPMEGLAPVIVDEIIGAVRRVKAQGIGIVLIEQNIDVCAELADRAYVLELGRIVRSGGAQDLRHNRPIYESLLGVG